MKAVVLWSGGIESTSILKYLLETTDLEITAVHLSIPNVQNRQHLELGAIFTLKPLLHRIRHFEFEMITASIPWWSFDWDVQAAFLPVILWGTKCSIFYRGQCQEDAKDGVFPGLEKIRKILSITYPNASIPHHPTYDWTKKQHMKNLGPLLQHTWSCWYPKGDRPCGACKTCLDIKRSL